MLLLSAVIGIIIGDNTWLRALALIGTKRVVFVDALKPFLAAVLSRIFLDESLTILQVFWYVSYGWWCVNGILRTNGAKI